MSILYARTIWLRNCGRFTHVSSDFGSQYHTHTFVTSEALYAALTRGVTWRHNERFIDLEEDASKSAGGDYFFCDYDVAAKPLWFTPGLFVDEQGKPLAKQSGVVDKTDFNVVAEGYPSTGGDGRPSYVPTYGRIESILPNHRLLAYAFSPLRAEVEQFQVNQTFMLGKKRTMFQVTRLSEIVEGQWQDGECTTSWLELPPRYGVQFRSFEVLAGTMRYLIIRGVTREATEYVAFSLPEGLICLPAFYLKLIPFSKI